MRTPEQSRLSIAPSSLHEANAFVTQHHRHHARARGCKFAIAALDEDGAIRGIAIVGRTTARALQSRYTAEVTRLCTDGCPNACSALYGATARICRAMGIRRLITYILDGEAGTSLKAAGWKFEHLTDGGSWDRPSRSRTDKHPTDRKQLWEAA